MAPGDSIPLLGELFRITYVENRAAVMGIDLLPMWLLALGSLAAAGVLGWGLWRHLPPASPVPGEGRRRRGTWLQRLLPWVLGGALGNLADRLLRGSVTDMFDVDIPDIHLAAWRLGPLQVPELHLERWWVFNLADSFIFVSVLLLVGPALSGRLERRDA